MTPKSIDDGENDSDGGGSGTDIVIATSPLPPLEVSDTTSLYEPDFRTDLFTVRVIFTELPDDSDPLEDDNESHDCCLEAFQSSDPPPLLVIVNVF